MQEEVNADQGLNQEFNLDDYRALLEQLETSKRNRTRLDKASPAVDQQPV